MADLPSLGLGVVTYNSQAQIDTCLESILVACEGLTVDLVVVDNASPDSTATHLTEKWRDSPFRLILREDNVGYAGGVNTIARNVQGEVLAFLNPDLVIEPDALRKGLELFADRTHVGVTGGQMFDREGKSTLVYGILPTPWAFFWHFSGLRRLWANPAWDLGRGIPEGQTTPFEVGYPTGAFWMVRRKAWDTIGPFDERYFLYFEETDWAARCHQSNWQVMTHPGIRGLHEGGASTGKDEAAQIAMWTRFFRSGFQFLAKHHGLAAARRTYRALRFFGVLKQPLVKLRPGSATWQSQRLIQAGLIANAPFVLGPELTADPGLIARPPSPAETSARGSA